MADRHAGFDLLLPEPPPLSHLGATLLRHAAGTGLRFALHQLGLAVGERPPVLVHRLRPAFDRRRLDELAGGDPAAPVAVRALLHPAGEEERDPPAALAGALFFHRWRLRLLPRRPPRRRGARPDDGWEPVDAAWRRCRGALCDALLAELIASLDRRRARAAGRPRPPCQSRQAARLLAGRRARLDRLGAPDPLRPSWAAEPERAEEARRRTPSPPLPTAPPRGRFRESYRAALDALRAAYLPLAEAAAGRGWLAHPTDAYFLPWDLAPDLAGTHRPAWLEPAVTRNRREWEAMAAAESVEAEGALAPLP